MAGRQDIFQQAMNQGHSAAWDQQWEKAAGFYRQALEEFPNHPQALTSLGLALIELQNFEQALQCYFQAGKALPDDPVPMEKIAQLYERLGSLDQASQAALRAAELHLKHREVNKAIENWERVTRLNPENLQAHSRLALVFERINEKEKAVSEYLAVASLLQEAGDLGKAAQSANQALKVIPNHPAAIQALTLLRDSQPLPKPTRPRGGTAPLRMSQVRQLNAPKESRADSGLDPVTMATQKALTALAGMLFEAIEENRQGSTGRRGLQAIVVGTGMLRNPVDRTKMVLHLSQVVDLQAKGDFPQAAEELQRATDVGLDHPAANFDLGYLYAKNGRMESAIRLLQHSVKHTDFSLGAHLLLGELMNQKGEVKKATLEYLEALKLADMLVVPPSQANDLSQLYEPVMEAYRQMEETAFNTRLIENIRNMIMRPDWQDQMLRARAQMQSRGSHGPPRPLAEILTEARSSQVIDAIVNIHEIASRGDLRAAMEEAFYALDFAPTYLPLHSLMGEMLIQRGDAAAAGAKFGAVAHLYSLRGEPQQAVDLYRKMINFAPTDLSIRAQLIDHLISAGKIEDAVNEYIQLAEVYYNLADLSMARKTYTEALRTAQQANAERSLRVKILHRMADIDLQSLDWRQAIRIYEQIRTLQPDDKPARANLVNLNYRLSQEPLALAELDNYLAYMSSHNQENKAADFLVELLEEDPKRVSIRRRLADLYRYLGKKEEAVKQYDTIGELLMETNDRAGALQAIEMILSLNPVNRADYEKLLEEIRRGRA
jgi:tetratricopeptide (TPR) repeat protein